MSDKPALPAGGTWSTGDLAASGATFVAPPRPKGSDGSFDHSVDGTQYSDVSNGWTTTGSGASTAVVIPPGTELKTGQVIMAPNGQAYAVMQPDGNFVIYGDNGVPVAATGTGGQSYSGVVFNSDGSLSMVDGSGNKTSISLSGPDGNSYQSWTASGTQFTFGNNGSLVGTSKNGGSWATVAATNGDGPVIAQPPAGMKPPPPASLTSLLQFVNTAVTGVVDAIGDGKLDDKGNPSTATMQALLQQGMITTGSNSGLNLTDLTNALSGMATGATFDQIQASVSKLSKEGTTWQDAEKQVQASLSALWTANNATLGMMRTAIAETNTQLAMIYNNIRFGGDNKFDWNTELPYISACLHNVVEQVEQEAKNLEDLYSKVKLPSGPQGPSGPSGPTNSGHSGSSGNSGSGQSSGNNSSPAPTSTPTTTTTTTTTTSGGSSGSDLQTTIDKLLAQLSGNTSGSTSSGSTDSGSTASGSTSGSTANLLADTSAASGSQGGMDPMMIIMLLGMLGEGALTVGMPFIAPMVQQWLSGNNGHPGGGSPGASGAPGGQPHPGAAGPPGPMGPTAPGAPAVPGGAGSGNRAPGPDGLVSFTFPDGSAQKVQPVVATALDREVHNPNGSNATAAYAGTAGKDGKQHHWTKVNNTQVHPGDIVEWANRSALVVPSDTGLKYLDDGQLVPLDPQNPHGDGHGDYGAFKGFFHPTGLDGQAPGGPVPPGDGTQQPPAQASAPAAGGSGPTTA